jgi:hypothetical protein
MNNTSLVEGQTIFNIDNEYYLTPPQNFIAGKGWKRSPGVSNGDYFRRVPGYSLVYYVFIRSFGRENGHRLLKYFQVLLFGVSVYCLCFILYYFSQNRNTSLLFALVYGVCPIFSEWVYFTLTDSLTSVLVVFYLFFIVEARQARTREKKRSFYLLASFFAGYMVLTRPFTAIAGIVIVASLFDEYYLQAGKKILPLAKKMALVSVMPLLMISAWTVRNYASTGEFVPLEKAFHPQSLDRMKPEFEGLFSFTKCWGEDGTRFNSYHQPLYTAAMKGDTAKVYAENVIASFPPYVVSDFGREKLLQVLKAHQSVLLEEKKYFDAGTAMPDHYLASQENVKKMYDELITEFRSRHFFRYYVLSPVKYLQRMVVNSYTANLFIFQDRFRQHTFVNLVRYLFLLLHISIYVCLFINIFLLPNGWKKFTVVITPLLFIFFFTFFHREIQQHYMMPVMPIMFLNLPALLSRFYSKNP